MADKIIYMRAGETLEIRHLTHEDFERNAKSWQDQPRPRSDLIKINGPHSITPATTMLECHHWKEWNTAAPMPAAMHHPLCSVQKGGSCDYDCPRDYTPPALEANQQVIAEFMIRNSFATGHGDTVEDLLSEFQVQLDERRQVIEALKAEHRAQMADMSERFRAVNVTEALRQMGNDKQVIETLRAALKFYAEAWCFTTNPKRSGLEWKPKEALLDDCGNVARAALTDNPKGEAS